MVDNVPSLFNGFEALRQGGKERWTAALLLFSFLECFLFSNLSLPKFWRSPSISCYRSQLTDMELDEAAGPPERHYRATAFTLEGSAGARYEF